MFIAQRGEPNRTILSQSRSLRILRLLKPPRFSDTEVASAGGLAFPNTNMKQEKTAEKKWFRVHLHGTSCGDVDVEAADEDEAGRIARDDPGRIEWQDNQYDEVKVEEVSRIDEHGFAIDDD